MSAIDEIKARIDIVDLAAEAGVKLRRSGRTQTGFCPFHQNTRTPAFVIWPETGTWRCFGECNEGGDIFRFVMKKEGLDFKEALHRLAEKAGVQLDEYQAEKPQQKEENARLRNLLEDAVTFYRHQLLNTPAGKVALDYLLEKRHLTPQTIENFGLGYAPHLWDAALKHFSAKGFTAQDLLDVGLANQREADSASGRMPSALTPGETRTYDKFRHRIMIPIRDENGKMAGFGGRILDPNDIPKFMNSPQTVLFDKGRLLYGLDRARKPIRAADQAVIVEGYLDVIAVHQAGFENVVSPMGTALTEEQLRLLKKFTRKIVLALDPDTAGQKAVLRGLETARASMDRTSAVVFDEVGERQFDAPGMIRRAGYIQADLRVAKMPDGLDPDEIVARNPDEWKQLIDKAQPVVAHVMDVLLEGKNPTDPAVRSDVVAQILPLIAELNPVDRETYRQALARRLKVREDDIFSGTKAAVSPARRPRSKPEPAQAQKPVEAVSSIRLKKVESACLGLLLRRPDLLPHLDRRLQKSGLMALSGADFEYTDYQLILRLVQQSLEQDEKDQAHYVETHLDDDLRETYTSLLAQAASKGRDEKLLDELTRQILQVRQQSLSESVNQLRFILEDAQQSGEPRAASYQQLMLQYARMKNLLDQA